MLCTAALLCPAFALSHGSETRSLARQGDCAVGSPGRFTAREQQNKQQTNMTVTRQTVQLDGIHLVCKAQVPGFRFKHVRIERNRRVPRLPDDKLAERSGM
jgi:hypothetical protein